MQSLSQRHLPTSHSSSLVRGVLRALHAAERQICASAVVTSDGHVLASFLEGDAEVERFGAMCASLLALADRAATEVDRGDLSQVLIEGSKGAMLLTYAGPDAVLAVASEAGAPLGKIFLEAKRAAQRLHEVIK